MDKNRICFQKRYKKTFDRIFEFLNSDTSRFLESPQNFKIRVTFLGFVCFKRESKDRQKKLLKLKSKQKSFDRILRTVSQI